MNGYVLRTAYYLLLTSGVLHLVGKATLRQEMATL